jgi:hypothetical protein
MLADSELVLVQHGDAPEAMFGTGSGLLQVGNHLPRHGGVKPARLRAAVSVHRIDSDVRGRAVF